MCFRPDVSWPHLLIEIDLQGRTEPQDRLPEVQEDDQFQELFLASASRGGRFVPAYLQCGNVLFLNKNKKLVCHRDNTRTYCALQDEGLKAFLQEDKVFGDDKMYCNQCNKKQDADFVSFCFHILNLDSLMKH